jgi:hypothetical protein
MIAALYSRKTEGTRPLFVSITLTGDWATGTVFPIGTGLASVSKGFNEVEAPGPANTRVSERKFYTSTPGHNEMLINHITLDLKVTITSPRGHPADPSIIKDHGDIWNERAEAMMAAIFRMANPMLNRDVKPRATLHRPPDFNRLQHP